MKKNWILLTPLALASRWNQATGPPRRPPLAHTAAEEAAAPEQKQNNTPARRSLFGFYRNRQRWQYYRCQKVR
jgi:hypothetical protein